MGAAPVGGRVASVRGLQEPLRQLAERIESAVSAELEVSRRGLTFRTSELHEKNNPFRRIAVWSALRLQSRKRQSCSDTVDSTELVHAFVPLVGDEREDSNNNNNNEDQDMNSKTGCSHTSNNCNNNNSDGRHADLYRTMRGLGSRDAREYPPLFAVVMRRPGAARQLECHAFACRSEEEAVAAAATLYRALLADLDARARRPRLQLNGLGCLSLASFASSTCTGSLAVRQQHPLPPPPPLPITISASGVDQDGLKSVGHGEQPIPLIQSSSSGVITNSAENRPVRPPRVKKNSMSSSVNTEDEQSSSSQGINISVIEKPRRKKKISDIKSEDILEARSRRIGSSSGDSSNESNLLLKRNENIPSSTSSCLEQTNEEMRMNAKNKMYGTRSSQCSTVLEDVQVIEKIYDEQKSRSDALGLFSESNKSSSERKSSGSYDFGCCTENSLYESSRIYAKACAASFKSRSELGKPPSSHKSTSSLSSGRCVPGRPPAPAPNSSLRSQHQQPQRRRALISSYKDHFRDVDKIYSLGSEDGRRLVSRAGSEPPKVDRNSAPKPRRSQSDLDVTERGDLMTRVELPRRGSFLKQPAGGSVREKNALGSTAACGARTPLGFTELFDEFRNQEGLTSVDDILAAIIDPEGMSFNELKPLYKEFLLKLAATLTQDELYQRSASIMRRRRRPKVQRRRSSRNLLRRAIKRSVSRLKSSNSAPTEFTSIVYPARRLNERSSYASSSSSGKIGPRRSTTRCSSSKSKMGHTTSEDSDTCKRIGRAAAANRSSSGYVSCSECSYDSESCTCISADKCYCSLSRKHSEETIHSSTSGPVTTTVRHRLQSQLRSLQPEDTMPQPCACDTDSCSESNKCYCASRINGTDGQQPSILEQLRQKGIVPPAESTLSRAPSPKSTRRACGNLATSKSLEYLKVHEPGSTRGSSDNLALDYDLFRPGGRRATGEQHHRQGSGGGNSARRSSRCSSGGSGSEKVLVVSARDPQGRLIYVGGGGSGGRSSSSRRCSTAELMMGTVGGGSGVGRQQRVNQHHEALSIKKSAEIAAVFASGGGPRIGRRPSSTSSLRSSVSLEAGLGYLP
ncbi:hypothetical protein QAD02_014878 [Eretmocerus hayati]|uniref:Uncharacterized protein n=1 Tax=Eretmocerus hayati TaxID=131215 RepID=A0ACC2P899_9HYME|nr:hypothetical protein QAD02_014878 [Eretmocerus hayati]